MTDEGRLKGKTEREMDGPVGELQRMENTGDIQLKFGCIVRGDNEQITGTWKQMKGDQRG